MDTQQLANFIRTVPLFHELTQEQLDELARETEERRFSKGDVIVEREQEGNELFIILEGELVAFLRHPELDFETELARLLPGEYFGEIAVISGVRRAASVRALTDGRAVVLHKKTVDRLFETSPSFGRVLCRSMAQYIHQDVDKWSSIPFVQLESYPQLRSAAGLIPPRISQFCQCLAVEHEFDKVTVAMVNPSDTRARAFLLDVLRDYRVEWVAVGEGDFQRHATMVLGVDAAIRTDEPFEALAFVSAAGDRTDLVETGADDVLPKVITQAIRSGASDVHIEPDDEAGRIRLRIDGKMIDVEDNVSPEAVRQLVSRIKVMAELDITNIRRPQDGRLMIQADERRIECRVSVTPCLGGEKIVLRLIAPNPSFANLDNLILAPPIAAFARDILCSPNGLVLVTGPTGGGKTTTLYAALNSISAQSQAINVVTIEEPVEYNLNFATQIPVNREVGLAFAQILRTVLRQDPDVILVGEIRDSESAGFALEAATTGHLVLSSLHTHSALETLARLRSLEVKPYLLADALKGVVSQTLVPRLCPGCTVPVAADDPVIDRLKGLGILEEDWSGQLLRGRGGDGRPPQGESGRVGVFEIMSITDELRDGIDRDAPFSEIEQRLNSTCFFSFARYCRFLLSEGLVAPERIERLFPKQRGTGPT